MNWKAPAWMVPFGAICAGTSLLAALFHNDALVWPGLWIFVATLIAANVERIEKLKATSSGIEFEARKVVEEARATVTEMQMLAKHLAKISLSLVKRSSRIGGFPPSEEELIRERTMQLLRGAHVPEADFPEVLDEWHRWNMNDYISGILGNGTIPVGAEEPAITEWETMRRRAFGDERPSPSELRDWLGRNGYLDAKCLEYLADYEYYLQHKRHRRPDQWETHDEWPRLDKTGTR